MFSFDQFLHATQGTVLVDMSPGQVVHFITDSRKLYNPKDAVFIAIKGDRHDGHDYLESLHQKGVRRFIIENESRMPTYFYKDCSVLIVPDSISAMQKIAALHRKQYNYPVIGITGSNGKTIIKEWLGQLLGKAFKIVKSPKSYNSQLGVPLSILQMGDQHNLGIFEAGISTTREMARLQQVIDPTIGVFTNLGSAHDEGFKNRTEKAMEKWKLFHDSSTVIYCADHLQVVQTKPEQIYGFTWGFDRTSDVRIQSMEKHSNYSIINLTINEQAKSIQAPLADEASLENVMHCISLMLLLGRSETEINDALSRLTVVDMRLALKKGINNCYLIDDSYNNDLGGLQVAIDFLKNQPVKKRSIIISDMLQTGLDERELCRQLKEIISKNNIDSMIGIGEVLQRNAKLFSVKSAFYLSTDQFLEDFKSDKFQQETILIKGARTFGFERITNVLSEKMHRTVLEINLDALIHNLNFYRSKIHERVKLMVMVKAAAYGNGSNEIANLLQFNRLDYLAVAYPDEEVELCHNGIELPIMVMNVAYESFGNILKYNLEPEVYCLNQLEQLIAFGLKEEKEIKIHIKIDSGMHRLGFEETHIEKLISLLKENRFIQVVSIYSHLAGADEERHNAFSKSQVSQFLNMADQLEKGLKIQAIKHILNSAGILRFPEYHLDMVRLGIGLYGFEANQFDQQELVPVSTLKTIISQIKNINKGETIGYGRKGVANTDIQIATIAIGYADGFSRAFSNGKIALMVRGKLAPVIGNVCMDMSMLDVTGLGACEGDEVTVFGENPTIKQLADAIGTIPYEILTSISSRVTRVFYTN